MRSSIFNGVTLPMDGSGTQLCLRRTSDSSTNISGVDAIAGASLRIFHAYRSGLTSFPALASCTALKDLRLPGTMIEGEAPAWLAGLPALERLELPKSGGFSISPTLQGAA